MNAGVVIGVDIGTTSTKSVAYDVAGRAGASHTVAYPLHEPSPGFAEQDPDVILAAVIETIRAVTAASPAVMALSFSSALHSLIGLDAAGRPLTPSITWADRRAGPQADRLRGTAVGLALHRRTGTPVHPMSPLTKLMWFAENAPALARRVVHWVGIKDYVISHLTGDLITDHSLASATGLMDIHRLEWDPEALTLAGITAAQLPALAPTTTVLPGLTAAVATATGLPEALAVVLGAGDGPLANLGLGAVQPGVAACSIGTSAAIRVMVETPGVDALGGVFCYALTPAHWAVGGAINNGGIVLGWAGDALTPDLGPSSYDQVLELAQQARPGSDGLLMLPYLLGERAPHWSSLARGAYIGLTREHGRPELIRAAIEGVCLQLGLVLASVRAAGNAVHAIRATGGFARSPFWRQLLADVLDIEIQFPAGHEGSSFGAALLALQALGLIDDIGVAADLVIITEVVHPDPSSAATYQTLQPIFAGLYDALVPAFTALRALG
jgi:gluconokinase